MLLLAVLSVLFMLGLGFAAIIYALADIENGSRTPCVNAEPTMQGAVGASRA